VPSTDGKYRVVPGHPSEHGASMGSIRSRPIRNGMVPGRMAVYRQGRRCRRNRPGQGPAGRGRNQLGSAARSARRAGSPVIQAKAWMPLTKADVSRPADPVYGDVSQVRVAEEPADESGTLLEPPPARPGPSSPRPNNRAVRLAGSSPARRHGRACRSETTAGGRSRRRPAGPAPLYWRGRRSGWPACGTAGTRPRPGAAPGGTSRTIPGRACMRGPNPV
jgi:hypothetical protein